MDLLEIIRQIEGDAAVRAQLRAVLLGDQFLDLPEQIANLTSRVDSLAEAQARTEATLRDFIASTNARLDRLDADVAELKTDVAELKGDSLERRVSDNPARYIGEHAERISVVTPRALDDLADDLRRSAQLSRAELQRLRRTDLIAEARRPGSVERVTVVAEVSHTLHADDVLRAAKSAEIFSRRSKRSLALAIGSDLGGAEVARLAAEHDVVLVSAAES